MKQTCDIKEKICCFYWDSFGSLSFMAPTIYLDISTNFIVGL